MDLDNRAAAQKSIESVLEDASPKVLATSTQEEQGQVVLDKILQKEQVLLDAEAQIAKDLEQLALARQRLGEDASRDFGVWQGFRASGAESSAAYRKAEKTLWDSYRRLYGDHFIDNTGSNQLTRSLQRTNQRGQ